MRAKEVGTLLQQDADSMQRRSRASLPFPPARRLENLGVLGRVDDPSIARGIDGDGLAAIRALTGHDADARRYGLPAARASTRLHLGLFAN